MQGYGVLVGMIGVPMFCVHLHRLGGRVTAMSNVLESVQPPDHAFVHLHVIGVVLRRRLCDADRPRRRS